MTYNKLVRGHLSETWNYQAIRRLSLRASELRGQGQVVANYVINNSDKWSELTVAGIAEAVNVSASTVRRALAALGISGLQVLTSHPAPGTEPIDDELPLLKYSPNAERLISCVYDTVHELQEQHDNLVQAARLLSTASFIQVYGTVLSAGVGAMFHEKLSDLGLLCRFTSDTDAVLRVLPQMPKDAVLFCVSLLGATSHMGIRVLAAAKRYRVHSVVLTNYRSSRAADLASVILTTGIAHPHLHFMDLVARSSQLLVLDVLSQEIELCRQRTAAGRIAPVGPVVEGREPWSSEGLD